MHNSSITAIPLDILTSCTSSFQWSPQAEQCFLALKQRFALAPILILLDPKWQFITEFDTGVGAGTVQNTIQLLEIGSSRAFHLLQTFTGRMKL